MATSSCPIILVLAMLHGEIMLFPHKIHFSFKSSVICCILSYRSVIVCSVFFPKAADNVALLAQSL